MALFSSDELDQRVSKKLSLGEFAAISFILILSISFVIKKTGDFVDYKAYLATAKGDFSNYFYGYWLLPIFKLLDWLPFQVSYIVWIAASVIGVWFSARVFNGNPILALLSYQLACALFWGQITGIICGMLGLFWWAIHHRKWNLAGIAFLVAAAKPQTGALFITLLFLFSDTSFKEKFRILVVPLLGFTASLILYPGWILEIISRNQSVYTAGNISLFQWVGPWALLLFLPSILVPMQKDSRFIILASTCILTIPYFSHTDLIALFIFPVEMIPIILGFSPIFLSRYFSFESQKACFIVPLFVIARNLFPAIANKELISSRVKIFK